MVGARQPLLGTAILGLLLSGALTAPAAASAGGAKYPASHGGTGGAEYGQPVTRPRDPRPVASRLTVAPKAVTEGRALPRIRLRIDQRGVRTVAARVVVWPARKGGQVVRIDLGRVRTGRTVSVRWPKGTRLAAGRYTVRVHAKGPGGSVLARTSRAKGRASLNVRAAPRPAPTPAPAPLPAPAGAGPGITAGVFPVQGPHTYGGTSATFGAERGTHSHQGQDIMATEGTPVVAPVPGVVRFVDVQEEGAGWYVVMDATDGRSFFFAHCQAKSPVVVPGQTVTAGARLCSVGSTGRSSAPHLHFEIWVGGWRVSKDSRPVDPLPQLLAWDR